MTSPARVLRAARKGGKRSSSTKRTLIDHAATLFGDYGYAGTSLDEVVAAARVTKGALYHHFSNKLDLFENVFADCQRDATERIQKAVSQSQDAWERARLGLREYLLICREPHYRRIVLQEGPVALGHERWHEAERAASLGIVEQIVTELLDDLDGSGEHADAFSAVFYGAIRTAGDFVADAEDPQHAAEQVEGVIGVILTGMRSLSTLEAGFGAE